MQFFNIGLEYFWKYWHVGILKYGNKVNFLLSIAILKHWNIGILKYIEILKYRNIGMLKDINIEMFKWYFNISTFQFFYLSIFQYFNIPILQYLQKYYNISIFQYCNIWIFQHFSIPTCQYLQKYSNIEKFQYVFSKYRNIEIMKTSLKYFHISIFRYFNKIFLFTKISQK